MTRRRHAPTIPRLATEPDLSAFRPSGFASRVVPLLLVGGWPTRPRLTCAFAAATVAVLLWLVGGARLVLHPRDPVRTATSSAIRWTFAASFAIAAGLTFWTVCTFRPTVASAREP